jgi:hypothetical protein
MGRDHLYMSPERRWKKIFGTKLEIRKGCDYEDWINQDRDKVQWLEFVQLAMDIWFPSNAMNFLTS